MPLRRASVNCRSMSSSPLGREKQPVMLSRMFSRTNTIMKANCESPARADTAVMRISSHSDAATVGQSKTGQRMTAASV
ncbi:conserved hypothetical protein [Ricinus communis]|uniref:Uncharacterized protein n=1 Tax=Ricinus communis TaxID=3988 RepID=B9T9D6_RICCO|nr:conserved hypothetical protein [Ricinus communis]